MKKHVFTLMMLLSSFVLCAQHVNVRNGQINLLKWDFVEDGSVALDGEWEFYMSQLLSPTDFNDSLAKDYIIFPNTWNDVSRALKPGNGFATYRLRIYLPKARHNLSLELPHFYSNYKLWVNGRIIATNGSVGTAPETSIPQWRPQTIKMPTADTLDLVISVSNFHHAKGGIRENLILGPTDDLQAKRSTAITMNVIVVAILIVIAAAFTLFYLFFKSDKAALYFAALAVTWALRSCFSNLYLINSYFPDLLSWEMSVKIEYLTLYGTMVCALLFLHAQFRDDTSTVFKYFFISCNILFCFFTVLTKASSYTQFLPVYLSFALILLLYILYVVVHAVLYERPGVWLIVTAIILGVVIFGYDLGAYQGFAQYNSILLNCGYIGIFILLALSISFQLGLLSSTRRRKDVLTYEDLYSTRK